MADDPTRDAHVGEIRRRFTWLEGEVARLAAEISKVRDTHPTNTFLEARLATIQAEIAALGRELGALETRVGGVSGKIDDLRSAWSAESSTRKNAYIAAALALLVTVVGAIILAGIGVVGG